MKTHPLTRKHWYMVALAALVIGFLFTWPFLGVIALAALMAFLFHGLYERIHKKLGAPTSATLTIVISFLVIIIPVTLVAAFTAVQVSQLAGELSTGISNDSIVASIKSAVQSVNTMLAPIIGTTSAISTDGIIDFLRNTLPNILRGMAGLMTQFIGNIPLLIVLGITYLMFMYEFLTHGKTIIKNVIALSPFQPEVTRLFLERAGLMATAMAKGQFYISLVISVLTALVLSVFLGIGNYFFLMAVLFTLLNLVPLGCGIVVIPITIIAMFNGMLWQGAASLALYTIISNLDAVMRPRIIPRSITLSPGLTLLSAFAGISMFGLLGVVYGPILMIIVTTAVQMYLDDYKTVPGWRRRAHK